MKYSIGLDCGIASVGFSVMELDSNDDPFRIIKLGARIFDKAENPKDGSSLAFPRRSARGARRRIRRHQHRLERIRYMLLEEKIISPEELENLFCGKLSDIYELRCRALDSSISNTEFARILIHLAQRRGFRSNRKSDIKDEESGKILSAVNENIILMEKNHYRTVGEMFYKDKYYTDCKRNKSDSYKATVSRDMIENEIHLIFAAQRQFNNSFANSKIEEKYTTIVLSQRPFDLGPGGDSPYAGNQIEKMIGNCTLIEGEKRAAKASYSFQLFSLWQNINHIKLISESGESVALSAEQRKEIFDLCHKSAGITYGKIREKLNISPEYRFNSLSYDDNDFSVVENKTKFDHLRFYHQIRKVLDKLSKGKILSLSTEQINAIGYAFTVYKSDEDIEKRLAEEGIEDACITVLTDNISSFSKFGHISEKACNILIPFLEQGMTYDKACKSAGFNFSAHGNNEKTLLLPTSAAELEDITNPVVKRAISQTIKVVNSIIREQGHSPAYINIELARELSKSFRERADINKKNEENRKANEAVVERLKENFGISNPTGIDIVKLKLYEEQNGIDPYTQKFFDIERLFEPGYADIDHIIPYSISFDDSYNNKVLTFSSENRKKSNKTPLQYLSDKEKDAFKVFVSANIRNVNKKKNLLKEKIDDEIEFKERNLNDTKYLSRVLFNFINDYLLFEEYKDRKKHVRAVSGAVTGYIRKRWGLSKIREDGDLHHALDATVIACITEKMIQQISKYSKEKEMQYSDQESGSFVIDENGVVCDQFPLPYAEFRKELNIRLANDPQSILKELPLANYTAAEIDEVKPCFVSRAPKHKVTGAAHKEIIRSGKTPGYAISRVKLSQLSLENGEIKNYYDKDSDRLLYNAIKERLQEFGGNGKDAFPNDYEFHKPKADGSDGPVVKKVKIIEKSTLNVQARGEKGIAGNGSMVRIDIFHIKGDGYYFVPVYVSDTIKPDLPCKACVANKPLSEWKEMRNEDFIFSLFPNDLIKVKSKKDIKMSVNIKGSTLPNEHYVNDVFLYFITADISSGAITVENHDGSYRIRGLGLKSLLSIEKYTVDPIGNIARVTKEPRKEFSRRT